MKKKHALVRKIIQELEAELERFAKAARASHAEATDPQSKAEHKYDTRGLEAAYLAGGQARKVAELEETIAQFQKLKLIDFTAETPIDYGALVQIEMRGGTSWYFIGPKAGGLEIVHDKEEITVITPQSPLGEQIFEKKQGDKFKFGSGRDATDSRIVAVR
ncbi:MAG TPA: transcription elongation factor GreAB [Verrucomicrobiae bacterium]|jgi:transcription elongation GreA/GreB family factor